VSAKKMQVGTLTKKNHIKVPTCIFSADTLRTGHCADTKKTRSFVDTVRNIGGKNSDRLLIVVGINQDPDLTCTSSYKIAIDLIKLLLLF